MIFIAITDIKIWFKTAYFAYAFALLLVIIVDIAGHNALGATRWFKIGPLTIQPSEIMKTCMVLALARYFYDVNVEEVGKIIYIVPPLAMIAVPAFFIFHQPDLGTALILVLVGVSMLFIAGAKMWKFVVAGIGALAAIPFLWIFVLYDYQKQRVLTFLNPNNDPLGSGYNIIQSKIAIGSGGFFGKGYLNGTQGQLDFLPEKQTDFIFTMLSEELGFVGSVLTIALYCAIVFLGSATAMRIRHQYGKLLVMGVVNILFVHMFINMGMVTGLLPVVGAPLPFISYGGTITASMLIGFGLLLNADLHKNVNL
jgi:rod shape determining protein RodA